ncbi:universal stress protein [Halosegnis rubeus]|jgi:nucleotide-binding universal stress UspA family protein|uniref:Universal stress protein n=1 Tax=Halosegnis rubeus TaxID=2212850 RepID=A0A5N5UMR8_9EURY|nr:universal stress protein [Halosegnis rubeus]KAB7516128.1 universal stress protein [Halosegnis rubeus]KAB7516658.1 universal stress protein [Halosegnis rubeus]KAB7520211.1 universal stress protein [Halosegnis rubeus]
MFDTVVIATDGSTSGRRAVTVALDVARRFEASVHALYVVDETQVDGLPEDVHDDVREALEAQADESLDAVETAADQPVTVAVREGDPATEIIDYADDTDADMVATGTRGRHGEHSFIVGSVAETVVRDCPVPVLTVRQLEA